ncbi:hypothetical protein SAMN05216420_101362 [Nitrosospira sp. Nl5]|nr:hypothetical protein SAMN05216420_101362 [Nitrosospira sp. Nl5]
MAIIKSTIGQRRQLAPSRVATGFIIWKSSETTTTECEFYIKDGALHNAYTGKRLSFEYGKEGLIRAVES